MICGHGFPNFYAKEIAEGATCPNRFLLYTLTKKWMKDFGVCKSIRQYGFELDADGDPLKEDCIKNNFITYYSTSEGLELFDALYSNRNGLLDKYLRFFH